MEYSKIVSVTGLPGLYELLSTKSDGAVVRSLDDNSTKFAASRVHNFSHLESIEIYTVGDNVNLVDVFHAMENAEGQLPDVKDNSAVKKYFEKVYPDIDFDRVYSSDLKKMVKWFEVLKGGNIEIKLSEPEPEIEGEAAPVEEPEKKSAKSEKPGPSSAKKTVKKKTDEEPETKKPTIAKKTATPVKKAAKKKSK